MIINNNEDITLDTRDECGLSFQKIHTTLNNEISWYTDSHYEIILDEIIISFPTKVNWSKYLWNHPDCTG